MPDGDGQVLVERDGERRDARRTAAQRVARGEDEVVGRRRQRRGEGAGDRQLSRVGLVDRQPVAVAAEGEQRLDLVIAVGPPRADVEREVDLGGGGFGDHSLSSPAKAGSSSPA